MATFLSICHKNNFLTDKTVGFTAFCSVSRENRVVRLMCACFTICFFSLAQQFVPNCKLFVIFRPFLNTLSTPPFNGPKMVTNGAFLKTNSIRELMATFSAILHVFWLRKFEVPTMCCSLTTSCVFYCILFETFISLQSFLNTLNTSLQWSANDHKRTIC